MPKIDIATPDDHMLFREFEHTGDVGIEIAAPSREELFRRAAIALAAMMVDRATVGDGEERHIAVRGGNDIELMHDLLSELLALFMVDEFIWRDVTIVASAAGLEATLRGEPFSSDRHSFRGEVKAITYHELCVEQSPTGWHARIIFDV
jgi:SHS2 domain-containing protein